ncbi:MAG: acetoacetyl-CoA synthetase [Lysobacterales bacterium]|jgi:acetoacetyl-CoA synthetase
MSEVQPGACWTPSSERVRDANISAFIRKVQGSSDTSVCDFNSLYQFSITAPEDFWRNIWEFFDVIGSSGDRELVRNPQMQNSRWFPDASLNFAENLLRYRDERIAIILKSENGTSRQLSYAELYQQVAQTATALKTAGVQSGDRVAAFMPNVPETLIGMLAATSMGAIWSSCSPDFGTQSVVDRLGQIEPKVLFCTDSYQYNGKIHDCLDRVREISKNIPSLKQIVVVPYLQEQISTGGIELAIDFRDFIDNAACEIEFERLPFDHPVYILYSSGTTGVPKCITHGGGGTLLQHLKELALHADVHRDDRVCYFTTCGWMMWNWLASNLALGATLVLYEGSPFYPGPEAMFDLVDEHQISIFGTGAKMISSWQKAGINPAQTHDLSSLKTLLSTGSPLAPESFDFVYKDIKSDLCLSSISGGTDIVSCFVGGCPVLPVYRGEIQAPGLAMKVEIRRDDGSIAQVDEAGELCCGLPFPSMPVCFWGDDDGSRYRQAYFEQIPGVWAQGDYAKQTVNDGYVIFGRSDATLNPGGVRIGTAEIYRQVEKLDKVLESICIGQDWDHDTRVILFVRLRDDVVLDETLKQEIRNTIRSNTTPRHVPANIIQVADIPRTVSGKIVELAVRNIVMGRPVRNVAALANPEALDLFRDLPELRQ